MAMILTLNSGSSSVKFGLYEAGPEPQLVVNGQVKRIGQQAQLVIHADAKATSHPVDVADPSEAVQAILPALEPYLNGAEVAGVGHRIVHGGPDYAEPVLLSEPVFVDLKKLEPLAPLHQQHNLAGVQSARAAFPDAVQIGCFDTAFHRGHPWVNDTFALPREFYDQGVRRYGFHGLSYDYVTGRIAQDEPELAKKRLIIAHLGNGASMCAVQNGQSVGSTMGFSALDGLPMGTRCGQVDPGVVLHLIDQKGMSAADVTQLFYKRSGLLGLSGLTSDMQELLASDLPEAQQAIDYYVFRARREIGGLSAVLEGLDGLIFCGGIGENAAPIREQICNGLDFLGIGVDRDRNADNVRDIGTGRTRVLVVPTDEEQVIARAVQKAL